MYKFIYLFLFVFIFNFSYSQQQNSSNESIINDALETAKEENKQVFVNYFSTECKFSKNMKKQMEDDVFQSIFNSNYIIVNIEIPKEKTYEYVNCSNPMKTFSENNCKEIKFPFWYILDDTGNYAATSFKDDRSNIGYPNTKEGINDFIEIIRDTSKFTEIKINMIENSFISALN